VTLPNPAKTVGRLGLARLGVSKVGFAPSGGSGARYAYQLEPGLSLYDPPTEVVQTVDVSVVQGQSFEKVYNWETLKGGGVDLDTASIRFSVLNGDLALSYTFSTEAWSTGDPLPWLLSVFRDPVTQGRFLLSFTSDETESFVPGEYTYEAVGSIGSKQFVIVSGSFEIIAQ